jgi:hypothetical protein
MCIVTAATEFIRDDVGGDESTPYLACVSVPPAHSHEPVEIAISIPFPPRHLRNPASLPSSRRAMAQESQYRSRFRPAAGQTWPFRPDPRTAIPPKSQYRSRPHPDVSQTPDSQLDPRPDNPSKSQYRSRPHLGAAQTHPKTPISIPSRTS